MKVSLSVEAILSDEHETQTTWWFKLSTQSWVFQTHYVMMWWRTTQNTCCPDVDCFTVARLPCQFLWRIPQHSLYSWSPSVSSWFMSSIRAGVAYKVRTPQVTHILRNVSSTRFITDYVAVNLYVNIGLFTVHGFWKCLSDCSYMPNATCWTFILLWLDCGWAIIKYDSGNQEKTLF